ncbi:MAG: response regulator transcription factor [Acidimicrobiaceae bacterium]|nr:response regulator transcription factor [Acidimicrobiaceae bacterium]
MRDLKVAGKSGNEDGSVGRVLNLLLVEDDVELAELVVRFLSESGLSVVCASSGEEAKSMVAAEAFDVVVLDVMVPEVNGYELAKFIRSRRSWTPIIMVTAMATIEDRLVGFRSGADDYLIKPFSFAELLARITALIRRSHESRPPLVQSGEFTLDPLQRRVWRSGAEIQLSDREFQIFECLLGSAGYVVSRRVLMADVWFDTDVNQNIVEQYIARLRKKVDQPFGLNSIETVHGLGYRLRLRSASDDVD